MAHQFRRLGGWPLAGTLLVHAAFAAGLWASGKLEKKKKEKPIEVEFEVEEPPPPPPKKVEPPPPPPPKKVEVEPPKPPPKEEPPKRVQPPPRRPPPRVARTQPPPKNTPPPPENPNPDPAPGPTEGTDDAPYKLPDPVPGGSFGTPAKGKQGLRSGTSVGAGGSKKGSGPPPPPPPAPVSIASIKKRPMPIGNTDFISAKNYPEQAKKSRIEGQVKVKLVIDASGKVVQRTLIQRLGYGLDQLAMKFATRLRFTPAIDSNDKPVAATVVWTFTFTLPK